MQKMFSLYLPFLLETVCFCYMMLKTLIVGLSMISKSNPEQHFMIRVISVFISNFQAVLFSYCRENDQFFFFN